MRIYKQRIFIIVYYKSPQSHSKLSHIITALNSQCSSFDLSDGRQQKRRKNGADANYHQQLNQSKAASFSPSHID
jgi:hypothetical protein